MTDGGGLIFTLSAAGNAAWVLRYRNGTRRPEMTLGPYPAISLSEARTMALVKRAKIAQGKHPIADRLKAKAALAKDWAVRQLIKDYREKVLVTLVRERVTGEAYHMSSQPRASARLQECLDVSILIPHFRRHRSRCAPLSR
jgi:hypothetical protein